MLRITIKNNVKFPKINLQGILETIAEDIIVKDLTFGIDASRDIAGGVLQGNKKATRERKLRLGHPDKPLIDTGKLRKDFYWKASGKNKVIVTIEDERKNIGGYLQDKGYRFFGISQDAFRRAIKYVESEIEELTSGKKN